MDHVVFRPFSAVLSALPFLLVAHYGKGLLKHKTGLDAVIEWYSKLAPEPEIRDAAQLARAILRQTLDGLRQRPAELDRQLKMFNDWDEEM